VKRDNHYHGEPVCDFCGGMHYGGTYVNGSPVCPYKCKECGQDTRPPAFVNDHNYQHECAKSPVRTGSAEE
jgi:hypothetical protein